MTTKSGRAFVIRPFGTKGNKADEEINFEEIHVQLIEPALSRIGLSGGTTGEFLQQGVIHEDMFREIVSADLVIADISIHNANAFYELGIRHALRDRYTVMIRADKHNDDHVFDLKPEKYVRYSVDNPAGSVDELVSVIEATIGNESADSPVFRLLPALNSVETQDVVVVPTKFGEAVGLAFEDDSPVQLLSLKKEVYKKSWEREGLREIARAMSKKGFHQEAVNTWEELRIFNAGDLEANQNLATHYQKLTRFTESEQAAARCLSEYGDRDWDKAQTHSLIASNHKTQWRGSFEQLPNLDERQKIALTSNELQNAYDAYRTGFECHRSHYYSGLNAVSMLAMQIDLANRHIEEWTYLFNTAHKAEFELIERVEHIAKLEAATELAITSSIKNYDDDWARISKADLLLLTCEDPKHVTVAFSSCKNDITGFNEEAVRNQLNLFRSLDFRTEHVDAAFAALDR